MVQIQLNNEILQRMNSCHTNEKIILSINHAEITLNKYFAIAISRNIFSKFKLDNNIAKFGITVPIESIETYSVVKDILQYNKTEIECDQKILNDLFHIGTVLGINVLIDLYKTHVIDHMIIDKNNCLQLLDFYYNTQLDEKMTECCEFISSHFYEIEENQLKTITKGYASDILERIISSAKLLIKNEDSLADFIISIAQENEKFFSLIEYIHFEFCNEKVINKLLQISNENNYINIIKSLHDSLLRSKNQNRNYSRFKVPDEIITKIDELKKSGSEEANLNFLDELLSTGNQATLSFVLNDVLQRSRRGKSEMLSQACQDGILIMIKLLIKCGCDIEDKDHEGLTPLIHALINHHFDVANYLISVGANKETPLFVFACEGDLEIVKYLISIGADKEAKDNYGSTPLIIASRNGHLEVVQYLISVGADKEAKDNYGSTPLIEASNIGHLEVVKYLISVGADKEAKDNDGDTPLIIASDNGDLEVVQYLISVGANKEAKNNDGDTPLIEASKYGHLEVVQYLISAGADKEAKNNDGKTAFDKGNEDICNFLSSN
ncbi:ankyrin repeat protein, putative [Trichomonas vaginalis G3]|uniref:Ankyrin repeat protein, putative n=1 Tax=Trichomonas vaginalis (strain ATCC PRA-98 / G3) TaxID=412133 RepID=A2EZK1_TRIV3|nr:protein ubiquitination [Trichomonas vaginalis G3]EAY01909.1 ankyrin repeat protein, putative [Trichomonas vaginalis G3]KAI5485279.1 protein ubiquitination [Trichomonas vaginalis G3]|eukprot:XP_001314448.1 ankyrin repeat protein [Trichomonas vaginalis G3]